MELYCQKKNCSEMNDSFIKTPHLKYQFMMKYLSLIFITFVIICVRGGFVRQMVLLTITGFYLLFILVKTSLTLYFFIAVSS